jgi:hypothetical protein
MANVPCKIAAHLCVSEPRRHTERHMSSSEIKGRQNWGCCCGWNLSPLLFPAWLHRYTPDTAPPIPGIELAGVGQICTASGLITLAQSWPSSFRLASVTYRAVHPHGRTTTFMTCGDESNGRQVAALPCSLAEAAGKCRGERGRGAFCWGTAGSWHHEWCASGGGQGKCEGGAV